MPIHATVCTTVSKISGSRHGMNPKFSPEVVPNKRGSRAKFQVKMVAGVYFTDQNRIFKKISLILTKKSF